MKVKIHSVDDPVIQMFWVYGPRNDQGILIVLHERRDEKKKPYVGYCVHVFHGGGGSCSGGATTVTQARRDAIDAAKNVLRTKHRRQDIKTIIRTCLEEL